MVNFHEENVKKCLLRTFIGKYEVYILYEIFVGLNKESINEVFEKIKNISKNYIVICAEHAINFGREDIEIINFTRKGIVYIG